MANDAMAHRVPPPSPARPPMARRSRMPAALRHGFRRHRAPILSFGLLVALVAASIGLGALVPGSGPGSASGSARTAGLAEIGALATSTPTLAPSASPTSSPSPTPADPTPEYTIEPTPTPEPTPEPTPTPSPAPTRAPTRAPTQRPVATQPPSAYALPGLIGAIGDSYTQAYSTSPSEIGSHAGHSWAVGETKNDGVYSLVERFQALGDSIAISDPAYPGMKMADAPRQAGIVVSAASGLAAGKTAFVTIAMGTNDLCVMSMTSTASYDASFRSTLAVLRGGLPAGSTIFVQTLVDFYKLRQLSNQSQAALSTYARNGICPRFLGQSVSADLLAAGRSQMAAYNAVLVKACAEVEATDGKAGRLHCRTDLGGGISYFNANFTLADFSTVDYFHPSLHGEGLMATSAWVSAYWSGLLSASPAGSSSLIAEASAPHRRLANAGLATDSSTSAG